MEDFHKFKILKFSQKFKRLKQIKIKLNKNINFILILNGRVLTFTICRN